MKNKNIFNKAQVEEVKKKIQNKKSKQIFDYMNETGCTYDQAKEVVEYYEKNPSGVLTKKDFCKYCGHGLNKNGKCETCEQMR